MTSTPVTTRYSYLIITGHSLDDPSLPEPSGRHLELIRYIAPSGKTEELRLYQRTAIKWKEMGSILGIDDVVIETIANTGMGKTPKQCVTEVYRKWIENAIGLPNPKRYPKNWRGLYNLLIDSEYSQVAEKLKEAACSPYSTLHDNLDNHHCEYTKAIVHVTTVLGKCHSIMHCMPTMHSLVAVYESFESTIDLVQ